MSNGIEKYEGPIQCSELMALMAIASKYIAVEENILLNRFSDTVFLGSVLTIGKDGLLDTRIIPELGQVWTADDTRKFTVNTTAQLLVELTVSEEVVPADGTYSLYVNATDGGGFLGGDTLNFLLEINDTLVGTPEHVTMGSGETGKPIVISGRFDSTVHSGDKISIFISSDEDDVITINGDKSATNLTVKKAAAAAPASVVADLQAQISNVQGQVQDIQDVATQMELVEAALSAKPTKAQMIEAAELLPNFDPTNDRNFFVQDTPQNRMFFVRYKADLASEHGDFHYEKLTIAE